MTYKRFYHHDTKNLLFADVGIDAGIGAIFNGGVDGIPDQRFVVVQKKHYDSIGETEYELLPVEEG